MLTDVIQQVERMAEAVGASAVTASDGEVTHDGHRYARCGRMIVVDGRTYRLATTGHARAMYRRITLAILDD